MMFQVIAWTAITALGAQVNADAALATASRFLNPGNRLMASSTLRLVHSEPSAVDDMYNDYYIFNTSDNRYVIVSGDDRAVDILGYGEGTVDMDNLPDGMQFLLELYKGQIEYLHAHPDMVVSKAPRHASGNISPLLKSLWSQDAPYNNMCPVDNATGQRSVTGCAATSVAMVFHYWRYPDSITTPLPAYNTRTRNMTVEALEPTSFGWSYMLNSYRGEYESYNSNAVAKLMRYVGQSEEMDYTSNASSARQSSTLTAARTFGYDQDVDILGKKNDESGFEFYTDENWAAMLQYELSQGRPLVYMGVSANGGGHAFNVDGYRASDNTYHVNFGWNGYYNNYYALNAFEGAGDVFDLHQCYLSGLCPPVTSPTIRVWTDKLFLNCFTHDQAVDYFEVKGHALTNKVTMTLSDPSGSFAISESSLPVDSVKKGTYFKIIYKPTTPGSHTATLKLSSRGALPVTVNLYGEASLETYDPVLLSSTNQTSSSFTARWQDNTPGYNVQCYRMELNRLPPSKPLAEQSFEQLVANPMDLSDWASRLDEITTVPGWTGRRLSPGNGCLNLVENFNGYLITPPLDLSETEGQITVKVKGSCQSGTSYSPIKLTCGENEATIYVTPAGNDQTMLMSCPTSGSHTVGFYKTVKKDVVGLMEVTVLAGEEGADINPDEAVRYEGITGKSFTINGLRPGCYAMRVQAVYIDGSTSAWSEYQKLELVGLVGDVNLDNEINIADINTAIDMVMAGEQNMIADINNDSEVNIADINALIDLILSGQ